MGLIERTCVAWQVIIEAREPYFSRCRYMLIPIVQRRDNDVTKHMMQRAVSL